MTASARPGSARTAARPSPTGTPYQLRHTFASQLLSQGANPVHIAKLLGQDPNRVRHLNERRKD